MTDATANTIAPTRALPLERKLPLLVLGLFTIVLAVSLGVSYYEIRTTAIQTAGERVAGLAQSLGSLMEQQTTARMNTMRRIARDTALQNALRSPDKAPSVAAIRALAPLSTNPADTATPPQLWDAKGQPLGTPRLETPADAQTLRDEMLQAAPGDSGRVSRLRLSNNRAIYYNSVPVRDPGGTLLGFIVQERRININPRQVPLFRGLIGADIDFYLRNADDATWVRLTGAALPAPTMTAKMLDTLDVLRHGNGPDELAATAAIRNTPMLVTVERPVGAILSRPLAAIRALILISIALMLLGAIVVWVLSRRIVRPLGDLTRAAEEMARGLYTQRVAVASGDEVGRLGSAFNRMAEEVQASAETSTRALTRLTRSMETQEFLAEASRILAGSVSDDTILTDLAHYCVPTLADYCSIHVADDDGSIRRIETAHRDENRLPAVRELLRRYQYRVDGPGDVARVIRTQQPMVMPSIDVANAVRNAPDQETANLIEEVNPTSFMCVPLIARGRAFGAISFTMCDGTRVFSPEDLEIAMELARRTAVAIDNAVIYRRSLALRLEAEAASNAKSDFLAKMSHEIRTPINAMMGYTELLQMGIAGPVNEAQAKQLDRIRASGDHLTSLINEILDLAKIEAGRMSVQSTSGIASDAVDAAVNVVRPLATTKGVELTTRVDGGSTVEYFGDPQRVHQILTNLLSNAVKFTSSGGSVSVRCDLARRPNVTHGHTTEWARIVVADTGVGIAPDDLDRIFQPFVQVESGYTRSHGGTGLGLTISRNLAQLMGGDITVESVLGRGSTFTLWLPCPIRALANA